MFQKSSLVRTGIFYDFALPKISVTCPSDGEPVFGLADINFFRPTLSTLSCVNSLPAAA